MRRMILGLVALELMLSIGCGNSQDDIRKYAIRRKKDDEEPAAAPATPGPAAANPNPAAPPPPGGTSGQPGVPAAAPRGNNGLPASAGNPNTPAQNPATTTVSPMAAPSPSGPLGGTVARGTSLPPREQRAHAIDCMKKIGAALTQYHRDRGIFPAAAVASQDGRPLLSWRVELLPYLGYQELYAAFHRDEPWDSPHNQGLLAQIPAIYQSPERFDENTNYLVPLGSTAAFQGVQGKATNRWEDGVANVLILLEVDDDRAVPWTAPNDWEFNPASPLQGLGQLRGGGFFAVWGDGNMGMVPADLPVDTAKAMFTVDGGESFAASSVHRMASADPPRKPGAGVRPTTPTSAASPTGSTPAAISAGNAATYSGGVTSAANDLAADVGAQLMASSQEAFQANVYRDAMSLGLAAYLSDPAQADRFSFQWIPALRRPAPALRYGVGLSYAGQRYDELQKQLVLPADGVSPSVSVYDQVLGDLGKTILDQVRATTPVLPPIVPAEAAANPTRLIEGMLVPLGMGTAQEMRKVAQRNFVDVLLLFDIEERRGNQTGVESQTISLTVLDVWTGQPLLKGDRINYLKRERSRNEPLFQDPVEKVAREMDELLTKRLRPEPIPVELRASHAAKRVAGVVKLRRENPLPILSEIKFYRDANLLTASQYVEAIGTVTGSESATELVAGTPAERKEALREWLPRPRTYAKSNGSSAGVATDEDD